MPNAIEQLQLLVNRFLESRGPVRILEAGCGSMSRIAFGDKKHVVGIDISEKQLERNKALDYALCGDIQTYRFPKAAFDIIVCWDVLEHLQTPEKAIERFFYTCKPGGLIILAFPNVYSFKGIVTKVSPHAIHVWYYKYLLNEPDAGQDDRAPFPTYLKSSMSYPAISRCASAHDASVDLLAFRESDDMKNVRRKFPILNALIGATSWTTKAFTSGRVDAANSDCVMVLRPRGPRANGARGEATPSKRHAETLVHSSRSILRA
jgi:SAM-dependent methyltransferase